MLHRTSIFMLLLVVACLVGVAIVDRGVAAPPAPPKPPPKLEPVAETKLLMEGLNESNFRGVEKLLAEKPSDVEAWKFMRGQALLIAETGNLLLLRPPKNSGETAWMERATDMREAATALARFAADKDYDKARQGLVTLATTCNQCHQTFRVPARITAFEQPSDK
jgi:hypothetical protein